MGGGHPRRDGRLAAFYAVVLGAMVVSIGGQMATVSPRIGGFFAFVFAAVNDAGAILALDCLMTTAKTSPTRKWAWVAILLGAGSGAALNAWHAIAGVPAPPPAPFPVALGLVLGIEPILMVLVLSHIIASTVAGRVSAGRREPDRPAAGGREVAPPPTVSSTVSSAVSSTAGATRPPVSSRPPTAVSSGPGLVATTGSGATGPAPKPRPVPSAGAAPRRRLAPAPDQEWMTQALVHDVVESMRAHAARTRRPYGEARLVADHAAKHSPLPDGSDLTKHKAREVKTYIERYRLLEAAS